MRDLNKSYKKIDWLRWHKEKAFIRVFCAFSCAILLIILLLMFPIVSDASETKISDLYYFNSILNSEDALSSLSGEPYQTVLSSNSLRVNPFLDKETAMSYEEKLLDMFDKTVDISSLNNPYMSVLLNSSDNNHLYIAFHESNLSRYCNFDSVTCGLSCSSALVYQYDLTYGSFTYYGTGINWSGQINLNVLLSTAPIMYVYYPASYDSYDYNYMLNNGSCGSGPGGLNITQPYPEESADNNLVLSQADYIFTHQNYYAPYSSQINTGSAIPVGTITFKGQPNDYQLEHPEQFTVRLRFHFDYNVDYQNWNTVEFGYFKRTSQVLGNKKNLKIGFGEASYDVPMSTFIQNKNSVDLTIKDVFDNLMSNGNSLSGLLAQSKEVTTISYNDFLITCYANVVSGENVSGAYIENYNFNSRRGLTTSKDIEDNKNPYTPNPSDQANDDPESTNITPKPNVPGPGGSDDDGGSSNTTNTTTTNGNGSIVINNNPTFNNNSSPSASASAVSDGSGSIFSHLIDSLFGNGSIQEGSIGTPSQEKLITNTGASRFFQVASDSMSWVPASLWAELMMFLRICLGILVVAFILRIILDFL